MTFLLSWCFNSPRKRDLSAGMVPLWDSGAVLSGEVRGFGPHPHPEQERPLPRARTCQFLVPSVLLVLGGSCHCQQAEATCEIQGRGGGVP